MAKEKQTNLEKYKDKLPEILSLGSICATCLAHAECDRICLEQKIDTAKQGAPCIDAWTEWVGK